MTRIILIRHGESLGNAERRLLGHTNRDLSELGYKQAMATAKALQNEKIDAIYSSDLLRAYNTALPHALMRGMTVIPTEELREVMLGKWEGMLVSDVIKEYGDMYEKEWLGNYGCFRFPEGEGTIQAGKRFYEASKRIAEENDGKTILLVAHAAVIRSFVSIIKGIAPEDIAKTLPFPSNASYSELTYEIGEFSVVSFSVDDHLKEVGITKFGS